MIRELKKVSGGILMATLVALLSSGCQQTQPTRASAPSMAADAKHMAMSTEATTPRSFRFTYTVKVPAPPPGTRQLDVWVPLPMKDPGVQEVTNLKTSVNGDASMGKRTTDSRYGNSMFHYSGPAPTEETVISWTATINRYPDVGQGTLPMAAQYLKPNRLIPLDGEARRIAQVLGADRTTTPLDVRAKLIYDDVLGAMSYDKAEPGYGFGDFDRSVKVCKGNCTDFHARFIGTGRAAKIPCRFTMGIPMKADASGTYNSYHCWAHWYDGRSWRPVDISEADKIVDKDPEGAERFFGHLDVNRIALSFGRDLVLSPPQQGAPLNYFVFPYAEADGAELPMDNSMWEFRYENIQP